MILELLATGFFLSVLAVFKIRNAMNVNYATN